MVGSQKATPGDEPGVKRGVTEKRVTKGLKHGAGGEEVAQPRRANREALCAARALTTRTILGRKGKPRESEQAA